MNKRDRTSPRTNNVFYLSISSIHFNLKLSKLVCLNHSKTWHWDNFAMHRILFFYTSIRSIVFKCTCVEIRFSFPTQVEIMWDAALYTTEKYVFSHLLDMKSYRVCGKNFPKTSFARQYGASGACEVWWWFCKRWCPLQVTTTKHQLVCARHRVASRHSMKSLKLKVKQACFESMF